MKVGFTGTREGMNQHQKEQLVLLLSELNPTEFHHGDCLGADAEAHDIVREFFPQVKIIIHPPNRTYMRAYKQGNEFRQPFEYLVRDRNIVDETEYLIGAPLRDLEEAKSGTWYTIRYSKKQNKPHRIINR